MYLFRHFTLIMCSFDDATVLLDDEIHFISNYIHTPALVSSLQLLINTQYWSSNICKTHKNIGGKKLGCWERQAAFGFKLWTSVANVRTWEICAVSKGCATELSHSSL